MRRLRTREGSLLVITLWMVATLSVLAVATARYLSTEVRLTKLRLAREQAKTLARSGVYLAMERLKQDADGESDGKYDWLGDDWATEWKIASPPGGLGVESRVVIYSRQAFDSNYFVPYFFSYSVATKGYRSEEQSIRSKKLIVSFF